MSDRPHGEDWWQGPDGAWYPPEATPEQPFTSSPAPDANQPARPHLSPVIGAATQASLWSGAGLAGLAAAALAAESGAFVPAQVEAAFDINEAMGTAGTLLGVATLAMAASSVLLIVWAYQAYRAAQTLGPRSNRWSPGWAIGAWFIPVANLVLPKLVIGEIDRISHTAARPAPIEDRWKQQTAMLLGHLWWALTVTGGIILAVGFGAAVEQLDSFTLSEQTYRAGLQATAGGLALWAGGAAAGAIMVGRIGSRLIPPSAFGTNR